MKYVVRRTSCWCDENPKVNGAQKEMLPYVYGRENQKEELREAYTIDIDSLEALQKLIEDCGEPIVMFGSSEDGFRLPEIEIYDDYRE